MRLNPRQIPHRDQLVLAGLYLSKFDVDGLKTLGFERFTEAFNVIGYALGAKPATIKNYRDEFDPLFPNRRKGWRRRAPRPYCLNIFNEYKHLDIETLAGLLKSFTGREESAWHEHRKKSPSRQESSFAKRLITGLAAERYFEAMYSQVPEFKNYSIENVTRIGCGYDFQLRTRGQTDFLAVEVKGLKGRKGSLSLTQKEYETAAGLGNNFFLFVVKNFQKKPFHEIYCNPVSGSLEFTRTERVLVQISWTTTV